MIILICDEWMSAIKFEQIIMENTLEKKEHSTVNTEEVTNDRTGDR